MQLMAGDEGFAYPEHISHQVARLQGGIITHLILQSAVAHTMPFCSPIVLAQLRELIIRQASTHFSPTTIGR